MNKISVITICFNNLDDVIKTCASVDSQTMLPFEHIIIDGSSKSDIKDHLEHNAQPSYRRWLCERDKGISDAFNKGIKMAEGNITTLLNSGDEFYDNSVLQKVYDVYASDPDIMWSNGKLKLFRGGTWAVAGKKFEKEKLYRGMHGVFHPGMFVKREVYDRCGFFDLNIRWAMDYDFICRIADEKNAFIDAPLAIFDPGGVSSNNYVPVTNEMYQCYEKYFGPSLQEKLWRLRLIALYKLMNSAVGKWLYGMKVKAGMQKV